FIPRTVTDPENGNARNPYIIRLSVPFKIRKCHRVEYNYPPAFGVVRNLWLCRRNDYRHDY
ncbi:MAG: hypothetical protein WCH01_16780, partial [Methylococcaceae bacterium]